jgi:hypothetical protein
MYKYWGVDWQISQPSSPLHPFSYRSPSTHTTFHPTTMVQCSLATAAIAFAALFTSAAMAAPIRQVTLHPLPKLSLFRFLIFSFIVPAPAVTILTPARLKPAIYIGSTTMALASVLLSPMAMRGIQVVMSLRIHHSVCHTPTVVRRCGVLEWCEISKVDHIITKLTHPCSERRGH